MPALVAAVKNIVWSFKMEVYNAERIRLPDCSDLVKNSDSIDNYSCLSPAGAKLPDQAG
jgi:hypothetical protein